MIWISEYGELGFLFFNPASTTRHKHIETSAGTDIEILADILERNEF